MLYEIKHVNQHPNEPKRRWFFDHDIDLTVWFNQDNQIDSFQLCYDKTHNYHALTWRQGKGFSHHRVDDGETTDRSYGFKGSPMLVMDEGCDKRRIIDLFMNTSRNIPEDISSFVLTKLNE